MEEKQSETKASRREQEKEEEKEERSIKKLKDHLLFRSQYKNLRCRSELRGSDVNSIRKLF